MKKILNFILIALVLVLFSGCGKPSDNKKAFNADKYDFSGLPETEEISVEDAKNALKCGIDYLKEAKSYSCELKITGIDSEGEEIEMTGRALIDATSDLKVAMMLEGDMDYALYIKDGKLYLNEAGTKTTEEIDPSFAVLKKYAPEDPLSNLDEVEDFTSCGIDETGAYVLEIGPTTIVIYKDKIMKVLHRGEEEIHLSATYDYDAAEVTYPSDLDSYQAK